MSRVYDRPILIQKRDELTEKWVDEFRVHARINKSKGDDEYLNGGAIQGKRSLTFEIRYFSALESVSFDIQNYRIVYQGVTFDIKDYDDYLLSHKTVKLLGVSY